MTGSELEREGDFEELDERDPATIFAQALEEPVAERLAIDQQPTRARYRPRPEIDRLLERQREEAAKVRAMTERRLAAAERALDERLLGGRSRRGRELRARVAFERRALTRAEERLETLTREADATAGAPRIEAPGPRRPLTQDRTRSLDLGL